METYKKETVLAVLALALDENTPGHHLEYLMSKLKNEIGTGHLDTKNQDLYLRMNIILKE